MRLLCLPEQGVGDCIMLSRFLPLAAERVGEDVLVPCNPDLGVLLSLVPRVRVVSGRVEADHYIPMGSLPLVLGVTEIPPPAILIGLEWTKPRNPKPRVGVCWKGSPDHQNDLDRSCHDLDWLTVLADERWELVSLQHGYGLAAKDYAETAELMRTLDAVVTVDSSCLHLAGTLGIPTIAIPPASPEWRWGTKDETSKWYPSVTLVRRKNVWAWAEALARCKAKLAEWL